MAESVMDFDLSDDQRELQRAARTLLADFSSRRPAFDGGWGGITAQGWLGVLAPERLGGLGLTWVEACVLLEQVGRFASPLPVGPSMLAMDAAVRAGEDALVEALIQGEACALLLSTQRHPLIASYDAGQWSISGDSAPTLHLPEAQRLVCVAKAESEEGLFSVAVGEGVSVDPVACVDPTRSLGRATFGHAPAAHIGGHLEVARLIDHASFAATADMLGSARYALELATAYAKNRLQFGQPIGSFQAVKHRLADMLVDVETMHSLTYWAAWCLSNAHAEEQIAAGTARWCGRDCTPRVMAGALQVHGGIGFTWEHELHLYMKRTAVNGLPIGGVSPCEPDLGGLLVDAYRAGADVI
jgi:alkylation response protein AidB-like acyl-CoA dehydrogenase